MHIGEKIRKMRENMGLTQAQLARKAGIGQPYISKIEKQVIGEPSRGTIESIAVALDIDIIELIEGTTFTPEVEQLLLQKGVGYCPNTECPGSNAEARNLAAFFASDEEDWTANVPAWEPYKTSLTDEDGELIIFCVHCGNKLVTECRHCGRKIRRFYKYCPGCGQLLLLLQEYSSQENISDVGKGNKRGSDNNVADDDIPL